MSERTRSLLVVSNRAPYSVRRKGRKTDVERTVGGLASTLDDLLRRHGGTWLAWSGATIRRKASSSRKAFSFDAPDGGYPLVLVDLTDEQASGYYHGYANGALWPLCHYFISRARFGADEWRIYQRVNRQFARMAARLLPEDGFAWVHDFHLALVPQLLRAERPDARIALFWHIPFPPSEVFRVMPKADEVLRGLLGADLIGFHTEEYVRCFLGAVERILGLEVDRERGLAHVDGRAVEVGAFPIGVEASTFSEFGASPAIEKKAEAIRRELETETVILAADRLDYTKGILERLEAYEQLLTDYPEFHRRVCFVQIQVPSRENVREYMRHREKIDRRVGRITGRFSTSGWTPVRYLCRAFSRKDLTAYYRAADVMLVTPLRDGMNLVAQEYVATRADGDGVLVFSEFAGARERLREALFVNPYDKLGMAQAMRKALRMRRADRERAMTAMRARVAEENVDWWLERFLDRAEIASDRARDARAT